MRKKAANLILMVSLCCGTSAQTQHFKYMAAIDSARQSGFYNILITPAMNAHLKTDYSDLRIVNKTGKWVPHLLQLADDEAESYGHVTLDLPIVKKLNNTSFSEITVRSSEAEISDLSLQISNTEAVRTATLTGSNDSTNWFIINDSIQILPERNTQDNLSHCSISFPPSSYLFYKLYINNKQKAPFQIIRIATSVKKKRKTALAFTPLTKNPTPTFSQKDSGRLSIIKITQQQPFHVERIEFQIDAGNYFSREVDLVVPKKNSPSLFDPSLIKQSFTLTNAIAHTTYIEVFAFNVEAINDSVFYLIVKNEDNLPLTIKQINTYSTRRTITAYLEKGAAYSLIFNNEAATMPNYDLQYMTVSLKEPIPYLQTGSVQAIATNPFEASKTRFAWMIWLCIISAGAILSFFTYRLVKEMNKNTLNH